MDAIGIHIAGEQSAILDALKNGDMEAFLDLIDNVKVDLKYVYDDDDERTLLDIACCEVSRGPFVRKLLERLAADPQNLSKPLYYAIENRNVDALKEIAPKVDKDIVVKNMTPFNFLVNAAVADNTGSMDDYVKCGQILLESGFSVSAPDDSGQTPIYKAAHHGKKELVELILNFEQTVDVDSYVDKCGKTARHIIEMKRLYNKALPKFVDKKLLREKQKRIKLFRLLSEREEAEFVRIISDQNSQDKVAIVNEDNENVTLLQKAIDEDLIGAVKFLIESGADVDRSPKQSPVPILRACAHGDPEMLRLLLDGGASVYDECLHYLFNDDDDKKTRGKDAVNECIRLLTDKRPDIINFQDNNGNTALHVAAKDKDDVGVLELLRKGASLAIRNKAKKLPIADICPELLKEYFDECVTDNGKRSTDENYEIVFDYRCFDPYPPKSNGACGDGDRTTTGEANAPLTSGQVEVEVEVEDDVGRGRGNGDNEEYPMLSKSSDACGDGDGKAENANASLKSGGVSGPKKDGCDNCHHEVYPMLYMALSSEHKDLLTHPIVSSFLLMKWNRIKRIFYVNILFYVLFFCLLVALLVAEYGYRNADDVLHVVLLKYALAACVCLLAFRELSQLVVTPKAYLVDWVNYFEIVLVALSVVILLPYVDGELRQQLSVVVVMFSSIEFLLLVGKHPALSTYIAILREVTWNFSKLLFWYSILLLAFSLSFYLLFVENDVEVAASKNDTVLWFQNPFKAALKTIVMFNGELNADGIEFERFPATSYATFLLFVFMVCIVLFNLLVGLAVDDVHKIRKNAEVVSHRIRIDLIVYIENLILGDGSKPTKRKRNFIMERLAKSVSLFCLHLGERTVSVKPNKNDIIVYGTTTDDESAPAERNSCCSGDLDDTMDKDIVKAAKRLLAKKTHSDDIVEVRKKLLEHDEILNAIREDTSALRNK